MAITLTSTKKSASLQTIFSKCNHIYFEAIAGGNGLTKSAITTGVDFDIELPTLEDSVSVNFGEAETTEINLIDGTIWTSKATKGDSDITFQVASLADEINELFMAKGTTYGSTAIDGSDFNGVGYKVDVKKAIGAILMTDDTDSVCILLPNVEMTGTLNAGDGDNPAYYNVTVVPKPNADGDTIVIFKK